MSDEIERLKAELAAEKSYARAGWALVESIRNAMGVDGFKAPETLPAYAKDLRIRAGDVAAPPAQPPSDSIESLKSEIEELRTTEKRLRGSLHKAQVRLETVSVMARAVAQEARDEVNWGRR